ncbi:MAG: hypothetical protein IJP68_01535 [Selenomonadaceae bacterium]|nr:hypothetical protein [Selenomonadaceae bacterium]
MVDEKDFAILDMRYKKLDDCEKEMHDYSTQTHDLDKRLAVIEHAQKVNNWLTAAIAGGIIALVIKVFIGG